MWIQCLIEHQGPFEYDVPNGDGTFSMIAFARAGNTGAQLANIRNKKHIRFLLEQRSQHFREWHGDPPDNGPPMQLSYAEMMAGLVASVPAPAGKEKGKAKEEGEGGQAPGSGVNVAELEGDALRDYAKAIGITSLPPRSTSDDTLRRAILQHLEMQHEADLEALTANAGEGDEGGEGADKGEE